MFFAASKIYGMFASPVLLALIVAVAAVVYSAARPWRSGRWLALGTVLLLAALATTPIGVLLVQPLEDRFPQPSAGMPSPDGIIVLGGAIKDAASRARGQIVFDQGERVVQAAILAKRYPNARVIFTGGNGSIFGGRSQEAEEAQELLVALGVDPKRITLEDASRNTDENARFTAKLVLPEPRQRWLLVTSAWHMPRSMGVFEKAGFNVTAFPVAFRTMGDGSDRQWGGDPAQNLETFEIAAHEWAGLAAYWATGRIDEMFPGPRRAAVDPDARPAYSAVGGPSR